MLIALCQALTGIELEDLFLGHGGPVQGTISGRTFF